ncbi:MAG: hypothetical protein H6811_01035 [Phycisphaeraceae bacterium]|nr:hypothetical protein [Phycisphaeraceae bacterium]
MPEASESAPASPKFQRTRRFAAAIQRFVVKRFWMLIVLFVASEAGGWIASRLWGEPAYIDGKQWTFRVLLLAGLFAFWLWPRRARFMKRLVVALVVAGAVLLAGTWLFELASTRGDAAEAWRRTPPSWLGSLAMHWLIGGAILGILMLGGLWGIRSWAKRRAAKAAA